MKKTITKKNLIYILCGLIVLAVMASFTALVAIPSVRNYTIKSAKKELFQTSYSFPESGIITAENGAGNNKKNSLLYVKSALQNGADCVEVDLCFDENGVPFIAEGAEKITSESMPLEYLVSYVSEESDSSQKEYQINLRLRDAANLPAVQEIVSRYHMDDYCFFTGVNINQAPYVRSNCTIPYYLDYEIDQSKSDNPEYATQVVDEISHSGAIGINCTSDRFSEMMSVMFKENWLKISFYDIETELEILKALKFSPNNIVTNNPQTVLSLLIEWNANAPSSDIIPS